METENSLNVKWFVRERHWRYCDLSDESCLVLFSAACQSISLLGLWLPHNTPASHDLDQQINTTGEHASEENGEELLSISRAFEWLEPFRTEMSIGKPWANGTSTI